MLSCLYFIFELFLQFSIITKLNGTNYKQWVKSFMMNLTIMKLNLTLEVEVTPKPTTESSAKEKEYYEDTKYSIRCCLMIMENHMEDSIYVSIPNIENGKDFLYVISKKYPQFSKNVKNELSDNHWVNVCFESIIIDVLSDTWWLDSGVTIHACNSMQEVISRRSLSSLEQYVYMGDGTRIQVAFLGVVSLHLTIDFFFNYKM